MINLLLIISLNIETYPKLLKQELDQYINNIKKSTNHLHWTTSKTISQILISQIVWQIQVCLKKERMKRLAICSFEIKKEEFQKIKFSSYKQGREENVSAINKNQFLKAANLLYEKGEFDGSLLINIMWCFASRPSEMLTLRLGDSKDKDDQKSDYYANKKIKERNLPYQMIFMNKLWNLKRFS